MLLELDVIIAFSSVFGVGVENEQKLQIAAPSCSERWESASLAASQIWKKIFIQLTVVYFLSRFINRAEKSYEVIT